MTASLREQFLALPADVHATLKFHHFDLERFLQLAQRLQPGATHSNLVSGTLSSPQDEDIGTLPQANSAEARELEALGLEALRNGQCAMVLLAGGMATRMGGVVKALVEALPGLRFLDLRLNEASNLERRSGQRVPLWLMTSDATNAGILEALGSRRDAYYLDTFVQQLSVRLTLDGNVFLDSNQRPSLHSPGHGDLPDALKVSGLLDKFVAQGGKYITLANIDNLGASLDPTIIGYHIKHKQALTCEVVEKLGADRGGIPVRVDGKACVLEEFRIPPSFDPSQVRVFNTNTFHVSAQALAELKMPWTYFTVEKKVDGKLAVQFERLLNELTSELSTRYLQLPRAGAESRFLPVKDFPELEQRQGDISLVARNRGMSE